MRTMTDTRPGVTAGIDTDRDRAGARAGDQGWSTASSRWCCLCRAIDRDGELIDSTLSAQRDKHAARRFPRRLIEVARHKLLRVTTDHHPAYRKAIRWILGRKLLHQRSQDLNNFTEQDHRAVTQRYYSMLGSGRFESAARFSEAFDELRQYFRVSQSGSKYVPPAEQPRLFGTRSRSLTAETAV